MTIKINDIITTCDSEGWEYDGYVKAIFDYDSDSGSMYRPNGDPGDPPWEELECKSFKLTDVTKVDEDGAEQSVDITDDIENMFYNEVEDMILNNLNAYIQEESNEL